MLRRTVGAIVALVLLLSVAASPAAAQEQDTAAVVQVADFDAFIDETARTILARSPEDVTDLGLSELLGQQGDQLNDLSLPYRLETAELAQEALDRLATVGVEALTPDQRITHAVAEWYLDDIVTMADYLDHEYAVNYIAGAHANFPEFMADVHPVTNAEQADAYVERLRGAGTQMRQVADNLFRSIARGMLPTERGIRIAAWQIGNQLAPAADHPLVTDLEARLTALDLPDAERDRIVDAAREAVESETLPAYRDLLRVVDAATTRPDSRPGALHHPDGDAYYAAALRHHTTTSLTPDDVRRIGAKEVERLQQELTHALTAAGFDVGSLGFAGAIEAASAASPSIPLRSDDDRAALLSATEDFIAESEAAFADMFTTVPASPIEVQRPRPGREGGVGAYYRAPPAVGDRPGVYYLALGGDAFDTATYATTNYHEAVPGHHFQIALQRESADLPLIQRATGFNGYAEGWALYAERLAWEAGLYEDDLLGNIGRLRMELLRAARAVVDTSIHAQGWSRDQAIEYLTHLGFPTGMAEGEVDRYIVWPGQAPAYTIGMQEILRLRQVAEAALGDDFDLAGFHEAILRHGSVPVEILEQVVADYVETTT
jgi:uncharacterized protein (DUF885 family)